MTRSRQHTPPGESGRSSVSDDWLDSVAGSAAAACQAPVDLLGEYLPMLADAAIHGRRPDAWELDAVRDRGAARLACQLSMSPVRMA